jgi:hypothetical protein
MPHRNVPFRSEGPIFRPTSEIRPTRASAVALVLEDKRNLGMEELSDQS